MSIQNSCKCDSCGAERRTVSKYPANYTLQLSVINTNVNPSGIEYAVYMVPPLSSDLHFCGFECLRNWLDENHPKQNL